MRQMELLGVRVEVPANTPLLLLRETEGDGRLLPIYIGSPEAAAIHSAMEGIVPPRPMTHDLLLDVVESLGARPVGVVVTEVRDHTFHAALRIEDSAGAMSTLSCRPSDACAIAVRAEVPIFASDEVLDAAGRPAEEPDESEEIIDEFQEFLENVSPEDFAS